MTLANSNQYTAVVSIQGNVATLSTTTHRKNELTQMRDARDITSISRIMFGFCLDLNVHFYKKKYWASCFQEALNHYLRRV